MYGTRFSYWITTARIQTHSQNIRYLFPFHGSDGFANAPQCYLICTYYIFVIHLYLLYNRWKLVQSSSRLWLHYWMSWQNLWNATVFVSNMNQSNNFDILCTNLASFYRSHRSSTYTQHSRKQIMPLDWWPTGLPDYSNLVFILPTFFRYSIHCSLFHITHDLIFTLSHPVSSRHRPN